MADILIKQFEEGIILFTPFFFFYILFYYLIF